MAKKTDIDHGLLLLIVALLAWVIPGAGHFFIKERKRAAIIFVTITATMLTGLGVGSIAVINPVGPGWPWYIGQMLASPAVAAVPHIKAKIESNINEQREQAQGKGFETYKIVSYGKPQDIGQIYTAIAGGLNVLCILSAVYMAHSGRGELIGREEDDE